MKVPLLDLAAAYEAQRDAIDAAIARVVASQRFIGGPEVEGLEREIAAVVGAPHAIACANGSDALLLALLALDVGPGDEVIVPTYTFFATAGAVARTGARPVFVDIDPRYALDLDQVERALSPRTRAVIPVHLFGQCVDLPRLLALTRPRGIAVIEDAAQAIGARWEGLSAGAAGDIGCFSFYPSKNLGAFGDGGLLTCADAAVAERLRALRSHGNHPAKYLHRWVGMNSRLDAIQAAILRVKLPRLGEVTAARRANAARYRRLMAERGLDEVLTLPEEAPQALHVYNQFVIEAPQRDALQAALAQAGVGTEVYYPLPLHLQECFADLGGRRGDLPRAEASAARSLAIPIYPELTDAAAAHVVDVIARFHGR